LHPIAHDVVGNCLLVKSDQDPALKVDYKDKFELD
jgi:carbamoyltransferase